MFDILSQFWRRLFFYLRRDRFDRELEEEMRFHLEMKAEENLAVGISPEDARYAARRQFGNQTLLLEVSREMWAIRSIETLFQDLRYGVRMLLKNPGFTLIAVLTLALGIGANTAIFSIVNAVLLRPLPFPESDRLIVINDENGKTGATIPSASPADFFDWKSQSQSFVSMAAYSGMPFTLLEGDQPEMISAVRVTDDFFRTLQVQPLLGRAFSPDEFKADSNIIILSHRLWQRRFGSDPGVVGKTLAVENGRITVVAVMPPEFKLPASAEAWRPVAQNSGEMRLRASRYFETVARLKPNVTLAQAEAEIRTIAARLANQYPESNANWSVRLAPLRETLVGDARPALLILFGAVGMVFLIACGNVANLLLARATNRQRELAIRAALGAARRRIIRQLITESLLLSGIGGALGALLARWGVGAIVLFVPKDLRLPRVEEAQVDLVVLGFTFAVALFASIVLGLIPGWKASRPDLQESLKEGGRSAIAGGRLRRMRATLVVAEIALTLTLLTGAGLLIRSLVKLQRVELGFNPQQLLVMPVSASMAKYSQPQLRAAFFERLAEQVQTAPGVQSVATASCPPLMYTMYFPFAVEGRANPNETPQAWFNTVSPNYFRVMGIDTLEGRGFTDRDRFEAPRVAVINETMRRRYFADEDPVGKRLSVNFLDTPITLDVVGVVSDIKQESLRAPANAQIYLSYLQVPWFSAALIIRTEADPNLLGAAAQRALRSVDPTQSGSGAKTMEQLLSDSAAQPRFYSLSLGLFAALALVLAALGVYGVISYSVAQRTQEIGVRMALGAAPRNVLRMVINQGIRLTLIGMALGLAGALALTRVMKNLLFEVSATDPLTFALIALLMAGVAMIASYIPARRAAKVDPITALRFE